LFVSAAVPRRRLAALYFVYFASVGAFVPYWGLYLDSLSFSAVQIGQLMAILMAMKIVGPNLWGWVADHTGRRVGIVRAATLAATLIFSAVLVTTSYWGLALAMAGFSLFWHAALPQVEATTMSYLGAEAARYSRIRVWGSIGFIVSAMALAGLFEHRGVQWFPVVALVLLAGIWLMSLSVPERPVVDTPQGGAALREVLFKPVVLALLGACFLMQASHAPYYAFFSIYLEDHGYSRSTIGLLWSLGVAAEVVVFLVIHRWFARHGPVRLLALAMLITALRWVMIARLVDSLPAIVAAQIMHAASYGVYHASAIQLIHRLFPGRLQGRGQALYSSMSFGLGGAVGSLISGYGWELLGPAATFTLAGAVAASAALLVWVVLGRRRLAAAPSG
jgi:PPP family 3-phenylpropionic acid transporter